MAGHRTDGEASQDPDTRHLARCERQGGRKLGSNGHAWPDATTRRRPDTSTNPIAPTSKKLRSSVSLCRRAPPISDEENSVHGRSTDLGSLPGFRICPADGPTSV